jgi:hypothetical protein
MTNQHQRLLSSLYSKLRNPKKILKKSRLMSSQKAGRIDQQKRWFCTESKIEAG